MAHNVNNSDNGDGGGVFHVMCHEQVLLDQKSENLSRSSTASLGLLTSLNDHIESNANGIIDSDDDGGSGGAEDGDHCMMVDFGTRLTAIDESLSPLVSLNSMSEMGEHGFDLVDNNGLQSTFETNVPHQQMSTITTDDNHWINDLTQPVLNRLMNGVGEGGYGRDDDSVVNGKMEVINTAIDVNNFCCDRSGDGDCEELPISLSSIVIDEARPPVIENIVEQKCLESIDKQKALADIDLNMNNPDNDTNNNTSCTNATVPGTVITGKDTNTAVVNSRQTVKCSNVSRLTKPPLRSVGQNVSTTTTTTATTITSRQTRNQFVKPNNTRGGGGGGAVKSTKSSLPSSVNVSRASTPAFDDLDEPVSISSTTSTGKDTENTKTNFFFN